ncbi:iron transport outer membrane receptor [Allostella sp. ATCC 35155]|nr:iron transport outer membrane receptor [Stella sp. ATCC 35155]
MSSSRKGPTRSSAHAIGLVSRSVLAWAAAGAAMSPVIAHAQTAAQPTVQLPGVTVSAPAPEPYKADTVQSPKFTSPLLDTPRTVTVIPREVIEDRGSMSLTDVLRTTPGITLGAGEGGIAYGDRPFVRGFDSQNDIFIDGFRDQGSQFRDPFNLEQVEILKGPSSAFTGRGSTGGSINIVSKRPNERNSIAGDLTVGSGWTKRATADVNQKIFDTVAVRLNAMVHDGEVPGRDEVEQKRWGFAPSVTFGLGRPTQLTLSYYHLQGEGIPDYGHPFDPRTGKPVDVDRENFYGVLARDFQEFQVDTATAEFSHEFSDRLKLRSRILYSRSTNDYVVTVPAFPNGTDYSTVRRNVRQRDSRLEIISNQTDVTTEFQTGSLRHTLTAGVELVHERNRTTGRDFSDSSGVYGQSIRDAYTNVPAADLYNPNPNDPWTGAYRSTTSTNTKATTISAFVFDSVKIGEQFEISAGARVDHFEAKNSTLKAEDTSFNWQIGALWKPLPNGSVYASYGTSTNPSAEGLSVSSGTAALDPEKNASYEVGTKWNFMNDRLAVTAAAFRTEKTNARVNDLGGVTVLDGERRVQGFEIGLSGAITPNWKVFGGYTFMDSKIIDDGPSASNDGNEMANVAPHSFSIWSTYRFLRDFSVGGGAFYMSERWANDANTRKLPGYWRFDAMASYDVTENVTLRFNVQNLFDETYYDSAHTSGGFAYVAPGRTFLLTTAVKF